MSDSQRTFDWQEPERCPTLPRAAALAEQLKSLGDRGIYLGTSSWKYPGWIGQIYDQTRYLHRGRLSHHKFNHECLSEYATVFPTVSGDFSFYQFPSAEQWQRLFDALPPSYHFSLKVPEEITAPRFPELPRYGSRAGRTNEHFMDAELLRAKLLQPLAPYRGQLGVIIFQFGTIHDRELSKASAFSARLDELLSALPSSDYRFAVEVRNAAFLEEPGYFECLAARGTAHCLNSWTRMPSILEQLQRPEVFTAGHVAARFLLRPGRSYQQAVEQFSPYERVQDPYPEGRQALRRLIDQCLQSSRTLFAFVNNRFEGNAVETIESVL